MNAIYQSFIETPLGEMTVCATENGICLLEFGDRKELAAELIFLEKALNKKIIRGENAHIKTLPIQLKEYFEKTRKTLDIPCIFTGTDFQKTVWNELLKIPYGKTRSYKEQAVALENSESIRAVANANGKNKIAILVPCHRVIGSNGDLTGYAGGLWRKKMLLELESENGTGRLF